MDAAVRTLRDFAGTWFYWFPDFAQSPGFAGCLAVVAAVIAYIATTRNARKEQWWKRAEYALNLTLSADDTTQITGLEMLDALKSNNELEQRFIEAATHWFLEPAQEANGELDDEAQLPPRGAISGASSALRGLFNRGRR
jgi:hypothetical protein